MVVFSSMKGLTAAMRLKRLKNISFKFSKRWVILIFYWLVGIYSAFGQASDSIVVAMNTVYDHMPYTYSSCTSEVVFKSIRSIPKNITKYAFKELKMTASPTQSHIDRYLDGQISLDILLQLCPQLKDTGILQKKLRRVVAAIVGVDTSTSQRVVVVDTDSDGSFTDEKQLRYSFSKWNSVQGREKTDAFRAYLDSIPYVTVDVDDFNGKEIVTTKVGIKPLPFNTGTVYSNEGAESSHLDFIIWSYKYGTFSLGGVDYKIAMQNVFPSPVYQDQGRPEFLVSAKRQDNTQWDKPPQKNKFDYSMGELIEIGQFKVSIRSVSLRGDTVILNVIQ
jgi:hypothetical protein